MNANSRAVRRQVDSSSRRCINRKSAEEDGVFD
jgi:hypothetical protein